MRFTIPNLLSPEDLSSLHETLKTIDLIDGQTTAGWHAKAVKKNQQLNPTQAAPLLEDIRKTLLEHPLFQAAVRPKKIHTLRFNHYSQGMTYGRHTDNALMNGARSDLSFTLFLSDPNTYEGGELIVEGLDSEQAYKLPAGNALIYPSGSLHRVDPVTQGDRWAVIGWVQSQIRDNSQREILFELDTARRSLFKKHGKTNEFDLITKSLNNLVRRWAE